ncbi:MAG TPA: UDP-2,3-diacylglucosamine diphosphatase LpxI, partial [bacterium]|nr:UDP-2,3-diacylglucosamine diphosphatase LpxI [bacterium]
GLRVAALNFKEEPNPLLAREVDAFETVSLGELGKQLRFFKAHGVRRAVMQGQVHHTQLYNQKIKIDLRAAWLLTKHKLLVGNMRTEAIVGSLVKELGSHGVHIEPATWLMEPWLASAGHQAGPKPGAEVRRDIAFGVRLTRELNRLDIGQTVVVKRQSCVAVESAEGTDACILRAGKLGKEGCVVVKLARPKQDLRFDLPVVGLKTFKMLAKVRAAALVLEAGKTLFLDKEACLAVAAQAKMSVLTA